MHAAESLVAQPPARAWRRAQSYQQTLGLSHHVVEMDAFSEQMGLAIRAARNSLSVSSIAPAGWPSCQRLSI